MLTGDSGEDPIELLCTAIVREDVVLASYQFTWIKDDSPVDMSNERFMVCICIAVIHGQWIKGLWDFLELLSGG